MKKPEKKHYKGNSDTGSAIHSLKWDNYNNAIDEMNAWIDFADIEGVLKGHLVDNLRVNGEHKSRAKYLARAIRNLLKGE